jgi:glycine oxidase
MEASSAAAGVLAVASGISKMGPAFELKRASLEMFPPLVEELRDLTGIDAEYLPWGLLSLIQDEEDEKRLRRLYQLRQTQGLPVEWLTAEEVWEQEPEITRQLRGAVLFPSDHHIHNTKLTQALAAGAQKLGARLTLGKTVSEIKQEGGRVTGVLLDGELVSCTTVVIAAGSWSGQVGELFGLTLPVQPAKGQMLACRADFLHHVISWQDHYLVPRGNGEVIIGSTVEFAGFNKEVTLEALRSLVTRAETMAPAIGKAPLVRAWAGLRPYSPTRRPILCRAPGLDNVILATGHHRNGILLAPITGKLVTELIITGTTTLSLEPFSLPSPR